MQSNRWKRMGLRMAGVLIAALVLSACQGFPPPPGYGGPAKVGSNPALELTLAPTNTPTTEPLPTASPTQTSPPAPTDTATATPTETATPEPENTATPVPAVAEATATPTRRPATATPRPTARIQPTATATPKPTPIVVIPNGFTVQTDSVRNYSLALPRGYTLLDLRSAQFRNLASAVGMGAQLAPLNEFLDSEAGQIVGILAASDLAGMIFGGLPTIAQVMVVNAKGASQDTAQVAVEAILTGQGGFLSNPVIETMENATINNLPGVRATVTGNLSGANRPMAGKVVGLLANDKFFVLIQLTETSKTAAKGPIFDQIIGTFRPE